jgi:hypothetical protein
MEIYKACNDCDPSFEPVHKSSSRNGSSPSQQTFVGLFLAIEYSQFSF